MGTMDNWLTSTEGWFWVRSVKAPVTETGLPTRLSTSRPPEVLDDLLVDLGGHLAVLGLFTEVAELDEARWRHGWTTRRWGCGVPT